MTMETIATRLRETRTRKGLSQAWLARAAGVSQGTIGNIETGLRGYGESVVDIAAALGVSPGYLRLQEPESAPARPAESIAMLTEKIRPVMVVGRGSGGEMSERIWTDGDYPVGATEECADVATNDPTAFLVEVTGFSMTPRYNPREYALVEPATTPELEDDVLVRLADGATMIKRLLSQRDGWRFGSYNDAAVLNYRIDEVTWVYYIAHPVPRRNIKVRC